MWSSSRSSATSSTSSSEYFGSPGRSEQGAAKGIRSRAPSDPVVVQQRSGTVRAPPFRRSTGQRCPGVVREEWQLPSIRISSRRIAGKTFTASSGCHRDSPVPWSRVRTRSPSAMSANPRQPFSVRISVSSSTQYPMSTQPRDGPVWKSRVLFQ
ncbi:hypothetical protein ACFQXA_25705 [Nocardiopsis composta]